VGYFWVLYLGINWATYVYSLVYLEALGAFFDIYITYQKNKTCNAFCAADKCKVKAC
jgi:hypothetical protein